SGRFELLAGPVIDWGHDEVEPSAPRADVFPAEIVSPLFQRAKLLRRLHWLECYACKMPDGSTDATCRWNNKDWPAGQRELEQITAGWRDTNGALRSTRQFALLVPKPEGAQEIVLPTLWNRLMDKA